MIDYTFMRYGDAEDAKARHFLFEMVLLCIAFCARLPLVQMPCMPKRQLSLFMRTRQKQKRGFRVSGGAVFSDYWTVTNDYREFK